MNKIFAEKMDLMQAYQEPNNRKGNDSVRFSACTSFTKILSRTAMRSKADEVYVVACYPLLQIEFQTCR